MNKRGQNAVVVILGLVIMISLIGVIAWAFRPVATGKVIDENKADIKEGNFLEEPFELRAWVVSTDGVKLDIKNSGSEEVLVDEVEVKNCGKTSIGKGLTPNDSQLFSISCSLNSGDSFDNIVIVTYQNAERTVTKKAFGNVRDSV